MTDFTIFPKASWEEIIADAFFSKNKDRRLELCIANESGIVEMFSFYGLDNLMA